MNNYETFSERTYRFAGIFEQPQTTTIYRLCLLAAADAPVPTEVHRHAPISRTVGQGRVVDEWIVGFTDDREMDAVLPGVEPTGRWMELPRAVVIPVKCSLKT